MKHCVQLGLLKNRDQTLLQIRIPYDRVLITEVKKLKDIHWSPGQRAWIIPYQEKLLPEIRAILEPLALIDDDALIKSLNEKVEIRLNEETYSAPMKKFEDLMKSKRYSPNTQKTYLEALKVFLQFMKSKPMEEIDQADLIRFNNDYIICKGYSASYQNQVVNAVKLFFQTIENRRLDIDEIHRPRREHRLPNVLSKEEVKRILEAHRNVKHKAMLSFIYACGLRRSELIQCKLTDVDSNRKLLMIKQAKGKKDRIVPLSEKILSMLRYYYVEYKPKFWLFEGREAGEKYDERSLSNVLKQALEKAKINKPVSLHWLRHSYATHLLEMGTDLRYIQELLGHKSSRTTEIYTHVSTQSIQKIKSPFDDL